MRNLVYCSILIFLLSLNPVLAVDDNESIITSEDVIDNAYCTESEQIFVIQLKNTYLENLDLLQRHNVTIYKIIDNMAKVSIQCDNLNSINNLEFVEYISPPSYPIHNEYTVESLERLRIPEVHSSGFKGKDVKVAIIDTGFNSNNPEISQNVKMTRSFCNDTRYCPKTPSPKHGTAVAEIIVDIAPEADLYLFDVNDLVDGVDAMKYASEVIGVDIVSMSLGWPSERTDGSGALDKAIEDARSLGTLVVVAAGNDGKSHWSQKFTNSVNNWHNFGNDAQIFEFELTRGRLFTIDLTWYHGSGESTQDLDLYLYHINTDDSLDLVESATWRHSVYSAPPWERLSYRPSSAGTYGISIKNYSLTKDVEFRMVWDCPCTPERYNSSGSIGSPGASRGALTVGAIEWNANVIASYSSQGPTKDGRIKPDVIAPSHVSTSTYGDISWSNDGFTGTSAAAPHVAAVAALLKSATPSLTADNLHDILESSAIGDFGAPGKDNIYGSGLIQSAMTIIDIFPRTSSITVDGVLYSPDQLPIAKVWPVTSSHNLVIQDEECISYGIKHLNDPIMLPFSCSSKIEFNSWEDSTTNPNRNYIFNGGIDIINATHDSYHQLVVLSEHGSLRDKTLCEVCSQRWISNEWYKDSEVATLTFSTSVRPGEEPLSITKEGDAVLDYQNSTRRILDGWYIDDNLVSKEYEINFTVSAPQVIDVYWDKEYSLSIGGNATSSSFSEMWLSANDDYTLSFENVIYYENEFTRSNLISYLLIHDLHNPNNRQETINYVTRTTDDSLMFNIFMDNPKSLIGIYKLQHKFDINSEFISSSNYQSISNKIKSLSPTNDFYLDSNTEFVVDIDYIWDNSEISRKRISSATVNDYILKLDHPRIINENRVSIPLVMSSPQLIEFFSVNDYYVSIDSIFSTTGEGWYEENTIASISLSDEIIQNNDLDRFKWISWNNINCNQPCDLTNNEIQFLVNSPESISTNHITQYFLEILPSYSYSGENLWLDKDSIFTFTVPDLVVNHQNNTRHVFTKWSNDDTNEEISLRIDRPRVIDSLWNTEHLLTLQFFDSINRELEPSVITMSSPDGEQHTFDPLIEENKVWLRPGKWNINSIIWQDVDVKRNMNSIIIDESKSLELEVNVHDSVIVLKDLIFPLSDIPVEISFVNGTVKELLSDQDGKISLTGIPLGQYAGNVDYFLQSKYFVYDEKLAIDNVTEQTFFFGHMSSIIYFSIFILIGLFIRKSRT